VESGFDSRQEKSIFLFSTESRPDLGAALLFSGYRELIPWRKIVRGMKLNAHLHLLLRFGVVETYLRFYYTPS
jgi:hypothetical protein